MPARLGAKLVPVPGILLPQRARRSALYFESSLKTEVVRVNNSITVNAPSNYSQKLPNEQTLWLETRPPTLPEKPRQYKAPSTAAEETEKHKRQPAKPQTQTAAPADEGTGGQAERC